MQRYKRDAAFTNLRSFCHHADHEGYVEVTDWANGEGYDVCIHTATRSQMFSLTDGEFQALTWLINALNAPKQP